MVNLFLWFFSTICKHDLGMFLEELNGVADPFRLMEQAHHQNKSIFESSLHGEICEFLCRLRDEQTVGQGIV